ncbi:SDR family NAD(P)-dependent oxidoreductase [Pseudomonas oleovorans]|uniref:SDR family NAD(P)-dependent oxidoreductase n=1 Tax=Ectopseudomonas oleovorans TaxID=301 RepID=UPI00214C90DB|nr:SDR family NAD(P)-dependent oxidoreductase [Pseudomonas oleovorans]MCR1826159.1 SDR family NAD(P)-dependent oxidoreductase [Pseudomonas oleovorans]
MRIDESVFLICGGASGLGLATARELVGCGGKVVLLDINVEAGQQALVELGGNARFVCADITREEDGQLAVAQALAAFGAHGLDSFRRTVEINLIGSFNLLRLAAEAMAQNTPNAGGERGVIINTASVAAFDGQMGQVAYAASKGGVAALTLPAARDLARSGIRVMCIAPGVFETPMMAGMPQEVRDSMAANVPFPPRLGRPDEYAALVRHIVENPMLNGEAIRLDGALRMAAK